MQKVISNTHDIRIKATRKFIFSVAFVLISRGAGRFAAPLLSPVNGFIVYRAKDSKTLS